jgi:predicted TIM-barrel fold metal-dependent hydrolase
MEERGGHFSAGRFSGAGRVTVGVDVSAMIGPYPFRDIPHPEPAVLLTVLDREGIQAAWVGHLPSAFHRDPHYGNLDLYRQLSADRSRLIPAPAVRPDWPAWESELSRARDEGAKAIRAYPAHWGLGPEHPALAELAHACASSGLPLLLTIRFEDSRQRHSIDVAGDLPAATVRGVARAATGVRLVVIAAGRALIEEVHWGLTPAEREQVFFDTSWIWGPPENDFAHLLRTIGGSRFVYGTGWPMRLAQVTRANLALLPADLSGFQLADPSNF